MQWATIPILNGQRIVTNVLKDYMIIQQQLRLK